MKKILIIPLFFMCIQITYAQNSYTKHVVEEKMPVDSAVVRYHIVYFTATEETREFINNLTYKQPRGENGSLSTTESNIFFLFSKEDGRIFTCFTYWVKKEARWYVMVTDIHDISALSEGDILFSKNN